MSIKIKTSPSKGIKIGGNKKKSSGGISVLKNKSNKSSKISVGGNSNSNSRAININQDENQSYYVKKFADIHDLDDEQLVDMLREITKDEDIEELYNNYRYFINKYVMLEYLGKFDDSKIVVLSYGTLQEFYVETFLARTMLRDPILSYMSKHSEFIKDNIGEGEIPSIDDKTGIMIFQDLPEDAYQMLIGNCNFEYHTLENN